MKFSHIIFTVFVILGMSVFAQNVDAPAPLFSGVTAGGDTVNIADYQGKVVILDFWASWCVPCRKEFPFLIELHKDYQEKGLEIIAVNIDTKQKNMDKFLNKPKNQATFPIVWDADSKIPPIYELKAMPTTIFIDRKGVIRFRHSGFNNSHKDDYRKEVELLLREG